MEMDGEADSATSAEIDRNNQSGWPTNYVVNRTVWWTQIWTVDR